MAQKIKLIINLVLIVLFLSIVLLYTLPLILPDDWFSSVSFFHIVLFMFLAFLPLWWFVIRPLHSSAQRDKAEADKDIRRLNRVLSTLSAVNRLIIRVRDRETLFAETCRIAVLHGGFRMAWIGIVDSASEKVVSVAHAGIEADYLSRISISAKNVPEGCGPTGTAIREDRHVVCNDIERDPCMASWRYEALRRNYLSSASFPLRVDGATIGALNLYATEKNVFDDEEVRLLDELASDVSFALELIEKDRRRREAEEALLLSKQDWEDTFNTITDMITIHDKDFNIILSNRAAEEILQIPPLNITRTKCYEKYHGTACPPAGCPSCQSLTSGRPSATEYFEPHLNRHLEIRAIPRLDSQKNVIGLIHVVRDISERLQAQELIREQKLFAENIIQNSAAAGFAVDPDHKIVIWNKACEELTGLPASDMIGTDNQWKPFYKHKRPSLADVLIDGLHRELPNLYEKYTSSPLLKDGLQSEGWYSNLNGKDRYIIFEAAPIRDSKGKLIVVIETLQDITALKAAEVGLAQSESRLRAIIEAEPECVKLIAADGTLLDLNPAGLAMIEAESLDQVRGKSVYPLAVAEHRKAFQAHVEKVFGGSPDSLKFEIVGLRGSHLWVETRSVPLRDAEGKITALLGVTRDMSETVKLEAQLRHGQKMEAVGTLTGGIAHDFNNILTAIIGYGNVLKLKMSAEDPLRSMVDQLLASGERAAGLTQSLLTFSRKSAISPRRVDLNDIIRRVEKMLLRIIGEDIELKTALTSEETFAKADSGQIEQTLINLATNARDAMPSGGHLTITTERVELDREFIMAYGYGKPGPYTMISVTDTGTGMEERVMEKIFEPFFTTKDVGKGTGLGLAIVYGIVKQHKGFINCYSRPDSGTTFKIYLPFTSTGESHAVEKRAPLPVGGHETILIAEDDPEVRDLTRMLLEDFGYQVLIAKDGAEAIRMFNESRDAVKLLLFDVIMPRKSGKEAYDEIRKERPDIKILFTSGYTENIIQSKGMLETDQPVILKPISPGELLRRVREALDS
ncbi:MAG: hypothetical protein A2X56_07780 [Nitrospirae bacterium GWC2_57_13]|nr:MAG: hypothetical protein A2X56_07780 [Nitrospirae bacterium GWC2_57_13]